MPFTTPPLARQGSRPRRPEGAAAEGLRLLRAPAAGPAGPRLAAAAEAARARVPAATAEAAAVRDVAAAIAAPMLVGYVLWLLLDARARGLRRLYFLSRDGQALKAIADVLAPRLGLAVERRYLFASRQAWNRALGPRHFDRWLWNDLAAAPSPADILRRLGVPVGSVAAELAALGLADPEAPLDAGAAERIQGWLAADRRIAAAAAESRALLAGYLAEQGVGDGAPAALVDLGWSGSQHATLCDLLAAEGRAPPACYLFGAKARASAWSGLRRGFYFDEGRGDGDGDHALPPRDLYALMETFCAAADGTLTGFVRGPGGRVAPVCAPDRAAELDAWGLPVLRATLGAAAAAVAAEGLAARDLRALRPTIGHLLEAFWRWPSAAEARTWGGFPWDAGQGHELEVSPLADPYTLFDVQAAWAPRRLRKREIFWVEGAFAMTPPPIAATLRGVAGLRARLGRLRRAGGDLGRRGLGRWGALPGMMLVPV